MRTTELANAKFLFAPQKEHTMGLMISISSKLRDSSSRRGCVPKTKVEPEAGPAMNNQARVLEVANTNCTPNAGCSDGCPPS